jgi:hypothetical protein
LLLLIVAGFDPKVLHKMTDPKLQRWWRLPVHDEVFFLDGASHANITSKIGLWDLGNRYDTSGQHVLLTWSYAPSLLGLLGLLQS